MRKILCLFVLIPIACATSASAQERTITVKGSVVDSSSGERIPYATIVVVGATIGTVADINGYFILRNISSKNLKLRVSAVGYRTKVFDVENVLRETVSMELRIAESPKTLPTVEVTGETFRGNAGMAGNSVITSGELKRNVGVFKNDVVQYVTQLPGVVTVSGVSSQYFVRGGGADQNLVMIDGMPVYNLSHAFGLFSFVDPLIVKVANFNAGGFQAQYGGRLSSVFDIQTIDGDKYNYRASGTFDLLSSDLSITGPLSKGNSSFVAFYRRPLYQNALSKFYSLSLPFDFYDGFAKVTTDWSSTGNISAEFLTNADRITSQNPIQPDFKWSNNSGAVSGNYLFGDQFDARFEVAVSSYKAEQLPKQSVYFYHQLSQISNPSLYGSVTSYTSSRNEFNFGFLFNFPTYTYTFTNTYGSVIEQSVSQVEPHVWAKHNLHFGARLSLEMGLRADLQRTFDNLSGGANGYLAEPRFTIAYKIDEPISIYAAYGMYHQRLMDLNDENSVFSPFDLMAPVPDDIGDEEATQYIFGFNLAPNILTTIKGEVYYKKFGRLVGVNRSKVYSWEPNFLIGTGEAYGFDLSFKYDAGASSYFEGNYSFGRTTRTFDGLTYFPRYDLRHQLNISAGWQVIDNLWLRVRWKLTSGLPYTPITGFYGLLPFNPYNLPSYVPQPLYGQVIFGNLNSARLSGYQSLDISAAYSFDFGGVHLNIQGTVINVYDKRNVFYINNITGNVIYQLPTLFNISLGWNI